MELLLKAAAVALIAVILGIVLSKHNKEGALLLTVAACCMIAVVTLTYLQPAVDFWTKLQTIGNLDSEVLSILLKSTGIAILAEVTGHICSDAGNAALGKTLQMLATAVILWLSLPLLSKLMELIEGVLVNT